MTRIIAAFILLAGHTLAATYYVRTDGNNGNPGTADTAGGAWQTVQYALNTAVAGDTINVAAGTYAEDPTTVRSGTSGSRITVQCNGTVNLQGFSIAHDYITWVGGKCTPGINISGNYAIVEDTEIYGDLTADGYGVDISSVADNGILDGLYIHDTLPDASFFANAIFMRNGPAYDGSEGPQNWTIQNCRIERTGYQGMTIEGIGHLIQYNEYDTAAGDVFRVFGQNHVIRRNYISGTKMPANTHVDFFQTWGAAGSEDESLNYCKNILVEENMVWNPQASAVVDVVFADVAGGDTITRASGSWIDDGFNLTTYALMRNGLNVKKISVKSVTATTITVSTSDSLTPGASSAVQFYGVPSMQVCQMDEGNPNMSGIVFNRNVFVNVMGAANNQGAFVTWTNNTHVEGAWNTAHIGAGGARPARSRLYLQTIPADGQTITLDSVTYTWKATADEALEVQIGATIEACRNSFYEAVMGLDGRNSEHPTMYMPSKTANHNWSDAGVKDSTDELVQYNTTGLIGNGKVTTETMADSGNYFTEPVLSYGSDAYNMIRNNLYYGCGRQNSDNDPARGWYSIQNMVAGDGVTVNADYNFAANLNYTGKTQGNPGNTDSQKFYEPNGINGGNPLFVDITDPVGPDGEIFTADDGLRLLPGSPLLGTGEGGADIGAYGEGAALPEVGTGGITATTTNAGTVRVQ